MVASGVPAPGSPDPGMAPGQAADGSEPADSAKIIKNTKATADNVSRLADYLKTQNVDLAQIRIALSGVKSAVDGLGSKIQNVVNGVGDLKTAVDASNIKLDGIGQGVGDLKTAVDASNTKLDNIDQGVQKVNDFLTDGDAIASTAKSDMDGLNVADHYSSAKFSGEITEGSDYNPAPALGEQSWFTAFLNSNPYKQALSNSGFITSGSCEMSCALPWGNTMTLSLCQYAAQFDVAGGILLGLASLSGFILLVRK